MQSEPIAAHSAMFGLMLLMLLTCWFSVERITHEMEVRWKSQT